MTAQQFHPRVNGDHYRLREMPAQFEEGDVIARYDSWAEVETSHWVVESVTESDEPVDAGYIYRIEEIDGSVAKYASHGELQLLAVRNGLRFLD